MRRASKILQGVGISYAALVSLIFILMAVSLPLGPYIVFSIDLGDELSYEFPFELPDRLLAGSGIEASFGMELGDVFIIVWAIYVILFSIAVFGPKRSLIGVILPAVTEGRQLLGENYIATAIKWFSVIVLLSAVVGVAQEWAGIATEPPPAENDLLRFIDVTGAPLLEEIGFRVLLLGLPVYLIYSYKTSARHLLRSLWTPGVNLQPGDYRRLFWLAAGVGVLFGLAHVFLGEPWTAGKFAQAAIGGTIIGWVYLRHGLLPAILIHWATNYFIFAYVYFVADSAVLSVNQAFSHPMVASLEVLFLAAGAISVLIIFLERRLRDSAGQGSVQARRTSTDPTTA